MPSKKNKNSKKGQPTSGFDYEALIPNCLSGDDRELVKKFLLNQLESGEDRDAALAVFAAAVIEDRENSSSDSDDEKLVHELKNVVGGSSSISAAEVKREAAGGQQKPEGKKPDGDASSSSSSSATPSTPSAPCSSRPSVVTLADHIAHLKISGGGKATKKKGKGPVAPVPVARARVASSGSQSDWEKDATAAPIYAVPPPAASSSAAAAAGDCQQKRVNPEVANEIRKNVNVGWWATSEDTTDDTDTRIPAYAQSRGAELYNFIAYPIGGMARSRFLLTRNTTTETRMLPVPESDEKQRRLVRTTANIPAINLPDLQLANPYWETYIAGYPSKWIDCDDNSGDPWAQNICCMELEKELNYAHYLGLSTVMIELWQRDAPKLAGVISKFLWSVQSNIKICIILPTDKELMEGNEDAEDERDIWEIWADFRTMVGNFSGERLCCGLKLMDLDEEFVDRQLLQRWQAEPICMFTMNTDVFTTNDRTGGADLGPAHTRLLETLWTSESMTAAVMHNSKVPARARLQYAQAIRSIIGPLWLEKKLAKKPNFLDLSEVNYQDVIQKPLQPLADNLQSGVYNTFEADAPKYKYYLKAVELAIHDMILKKGSGDIVLYVLGAGRGPLMSAAMAAEQLVNSVVARSGPYVKLELIAVEKNENAVVTLQYLNATTWRGRVRIVQADMRDLAVTAKGLGLRRPDIIVSELLGSFGDNELSPECLDGCVDWMKKETISIPQSYTSYCEPVASLSLFHSIKAQPNSYFFKGRQANGRELTQKQTDGTYTQAFPEGREVAAQDMLYVVYLDKVVRQFQPKSYFTFHHPCPDRAQTERPRWRIAQQWEVPTSQEIMGFACYFTAHLYKDVTLSIVRGQETPDMLSWFPAVLPLREPLRVHKGEQVTFVVERCHDNGGVWYEWFAMVSGPDLTVPPRMTQLQNKDGVSYYMRLSTEKKEETEEVELEEDSTQEDEDEEEDEGEEEEEYKEKKPEREIPSPLSRIEMMR